MNVDGKGVFDKLQEVQIVIHVKIRVHTALKQDLSSAQINGFRYLFSDLRLRDDKSVRMPRPAVKCAETAPGYTDIGVIDVPVDYVGDDLARVLFFSLPVGKYSKVQEIGVFKQIKSITAVNPAIIF